MGGGLVQLCNYGAPDIYLTGNPENGEPFWGYRSKCTLYSNPYCPTLEYSHLSTGDMVPIPRAERYNSTQDTLSTLETFSKFNWEIKNKIKGPLVIKREDLTNLKKSFGSEFKSIITNESILNFREEMKSKKSLTT